jgi:outer membrane lipoprotein SlyB
MSLRLTSPRFTSIRVLSAMLLLAIVSGCGPDYSPNTYDSGAVQQSAKVEPGVVVGVRGVDVSAPGMVGAATGAAAGGIVGSQTPGNVGSAFGALGGALVGGIVGSAAEHSVADTTAYEYIVRKPNGDMLSVTQRDKAPLAIGQKVLVIDGKQARIVPDYTVPVATTPPKPAEPAAGSPGQGGTSTVPPAVHVEATPLAAPTSLAPPAGAAGGVAPSPAAPPLTPAAVPAAPPPLAAQVPPPPVISATPLAPLAPAVPTSAPASVPPPAAPAGGPTPLAPPP